MPAGRLHAACRSELAAHIALLTLALISGLAWCSEVESQLGAGWDQLTIEYRSRRVVPGSFAAFIIWALGVVRVQRPSAFIALLAGYAGFVILGIEGLWQLQLWLNRQDSSQTRGYIPFVLLGFPSVLFLWSLVPMGFCAICRKFGMHINSGFGMLAGMSFVLAWPLSGLTWLCARQTNLGVMSVDFVSMLTNGSLTPFLIISLGLPILAARSAADVIAASRLKVTPLA